MGIFGWRLAFVIKCPENENTPDNVGGRECATNGHITVMLLAIRGGARVATTC